MDLVFLSLLFSAPVLLAFFFSSSLLCDEFSLLPLWNPVCLSLGFTNSRNTFPFCKSSRPLDSLALCILLFCVFFCCVSLAIDSCFFLLFFSTLCFFNLDFSFWQENAETTGGGGGGGGTISESIWKHLFILVSFARLVSSIITLSGRTASFLRFVSDFLICF